jgi:uncharacterized protein
MHWPLVLAAFFAGAQNALAGGGSFITFPALMLAGQTSLAANMTSTVALFPSQITIAWASRTMANGAAGLGLRRLVGVSLVGGIAGALLLVFTPASFFQRLVPWLVLFATLVFAFGQRMRRRAASSNEGHTPMSRWKLTLAQFCIAVYGGYFGGGIGFLMLAALTIAGQGAREAGATKNLLAMVMNASAVAIFAASGKVAWGMAGAVCIGSIAGGFAGTWLLKRLPEGVLRGFVVAVGGVLTVWLFVRA